MSLLLSLAFAVQAQDTTAPATPAASASPASPATESHFAANLGLLGTGLSLGNSARWTGVRLNFQDAGVTRLNGLSVTLWKAKQGGNQSARVNGIAVGLVGPEAGEF